ncbi:MAG: hypothetical protein HY841_15110 [Bacteroidetes bacterium]|nr:hypothetical protein [Bacteroidota bacterium]
MKKKFILVISLLFFFLPEAIFACSVCKGGASQEKLDAYILTTGILAGLPILMGLLFFFLFRRASRATKLNP